MNRYDVLMWLGAALLGATSGNTVTGLIGLILVAVGTRLSTLEDFGINTGE